MDWTLAFGAALTTGGLFVLYGLRAQKAWRASVRRELLAYLGVVRPQWEVAGVTGDRLDLRLPGGEEVTCRLQRLVAAAGATPANDLAARHALFAAWLGVLEEHVRSLALDAERDLPRLRPRLVPAAFVAAQEGRAALPCADLGAGDLRVVFVLDGRESVRYLNAEALAELGLDVARALALARENLRDSLPQSTVREVVDGGAERRVAVGDTYDAARVLVVGEHLAVGERVVARIPDRDTLVLSPWPDDGNFGPASQGAGAAGDRDPLCATPLAVSALGITAAAGSRTG
jgi:hypothetical protein